VKNGRWNNDFWTNEMDQQLVQFLGQLAQRLNQGVLNLTELQITTGANRAVMCHYPILQSKGVTASEMYLRYLLLRLFNQRFTAVLALIDLSVKLVNKGWSIGSKVCSLRTLLFTESKMNYLDKVLNKSQELDQVPPTINLNRMLTDKAKLQESNKDLTSLFGQAFLQLNSKDPKSLRVKQIAWLVHFVGESSVDAGGLYRESISQFCTELQSDALSLFINCPNGQHKIGENREKYIPKPSSNSPDQLEMFVFFGKLLGVALRTKFVLNMDLSSTIWKILVNQPLTTEDLKEIDTLCVQSLDALRNIHLQGVSEENFGSVITEVFSIQLSDGKELELKKGGKNVPVTFENRHEWADLVEKVRLHESRQQILAIRHGLSTIVPLQLLQLFTWRELEVRLEGKPMMDISLLKKRTVYRGGFSSKDKVIINFWKALESFTPEEHALFLRFTWGRSRLPFTASEFTSDFKIHKMSCGKADEVLPKSHTCFFELELPSYSTYEILREKLLYAITECQAIDTDFDPGDGIPALLGLY